MAYQCWVGGKPEYSSELECVVTLATTLEGFEDDFYLLVNFNVGRQIDLAVLKKNGVFIVELKAWGKNRLRSRFNGPWEVEGENGIFSPVRDRRNPFSQVSAQYYYFSNWLEGCKHNFLSEQKASFTSFKNIKSYIAISPTLSLDPKSDTLPQIQIIGFDQLHDYLYEGSSKDVCLEESEILKLLKALNLSRWNDIHDLVTSMTGPDEYDWKGYCEQLATKLGEKLIFYVPLKAWILEQVPEKPFKEIIKLIELWEFIKNNDRIIVLGDPGSGKSTTLEDLVFKLALNYPEHQSPLIPVTIPLGLYNSRLDGLFGLLHSSLSKYGLDIAAKALVDILRRKNNFIFFFDGLNEIPAEERRYALLDLRRFLMDYPQHKFVLSSREESEIPDINEIRKVYLYPFSDEDVIRYLRESFKHYGVIDIDDMAIQQKAEKVGVDILSNPLYCYLYSAILREDPDSEISAVFQLFDIFVQIQFRKCRDHNTHIGVKSSALELALCSLAYEMFKSGRYSLADAEFDHVLKSIYSNSKEQGLLSCTFDNLREILMVSPFLTREDGKTFFLHSRLQIYFASKLLAEELAAQDPSALDKMMDFYWNDVSLFALNYISNMEVGKLLSRAASCDNFYVLGRCLTGNGGKEAHKRAHAIVEQLMNSTKHSDRLIAVRILGEARDSYNGFKSLLDILSSEERYLEEQFKQKGWNLFDEANDSNISIVAFLNSQESLSDPNNIHILSTDLMIFKEAQYFLRKLVHPKIARQFVNIIDEYENYSITARCWLIEIISTIESKVDKERILEFLFSRIFKSYEKYIQVNSVAYNVLAVDLGYGDISNIKHPQTGEKPIPGSEDYALLLWENYEREEDIYFFGGESAIDLPSIFWDIKNKLEGTRIISESDIGKYYEFIKYILSIKSRSHLSNEYFSQLFQIIPDRPMASDSFLQNELRPRSLEESIDPDKSVYAFLLDYISKICLISDENALETLTELAKEPEPIIKIILASWP